ncbi:sensor histidine kinase [Brevundimonas diminuta]|uniref:histidine kinase n=1 Tax=Brevundimonas diminuta TaxID=293 RepID=A0A1Z3LVG6_BREDI|nr:HAMP domain-containing sensor histidine kinase [Brevundimonas diminuta]ASD26212.1 hypothetical protein CD943_04500 [Brevundimonas diminuta]
MMRWLPRSLGLQLVVILLLAQVAAIVAWLMLPMLVSPYVSYGELAAGSTRVHILNALEDTPQGLRLSATPRLDRYLNERPGLEYAVASEGRVVAASSSAFATRLAPALSEMEWGAELYRAPRDAVRAVRMVRQGRPVLIVTRGDRFRSDDLPQLFQAYLPQLLLMFAPALLAAAIIAPLAVRFALGGARTASAQATGIHLGSLQRRLDEKGLPAEILPLVRAINGLLERLQEGMRRRELFVANAAHELRTPVAVLGARIGALPPGDTRDTLSGDARRLTILVDQLLAAARLRADDRLAFESLDVGELVRGLLADMAPLAIRSGKGLEFGGLQGAMVQGDPEALRSALANLIDNALRATPEDTTVVVELGANTDDVAIRVIDRGNGVAHGDREAVFEPFWRASPRGHGAGLGLAIVRAVANAHGGRVSVVETPGGGATFILSLPSIARAGA